MKKPITLGLLVVGLALAGVRDANAQSLPAHDTNMKTQHDAQNTDHSVLKGQHDAQTTDHNTLKGQHDAQTTQHNTLSGQATTHDAAQTAQHNNLSGQISTLSQQINNLPTPDLRGLPQAWDETLSAIDLFNGPCNSNRFTCVMGGAAVRDNETGLVWEREPSTTTATWVQARLDCVFRIVGGRKAWRVPSFAELSSLIDPSVASPGPTLPAGHPFTNVQTSSSYWSATSDASFPADAWFVNFFSGNTALDAKSGVFFVWCVRGGMNAGQY